MNKRAKGAMKWDTESPCESCPYRVDAKLELWDRSEFAKLLDNDGDALRGAIYGCHGTAKLPAPSVCAGWLLDQKRRSIPSIQLRLVLMRRDEAMRALDTVHDGGHELYESIEEMIEANFPELLE